MANVSPNHFLLRGFDIRVTYLTANGFGQPVFTYQDAQETKTFTGPQVRVTDTEVGKLVSVTIHPTIDTISVSFSVLIPVVVLTSGSDKEAFQTEGIRTTHKTPLVLPNKGARETYQFTQLHGTAEKVEVPLIAAVPVAAASA